MTNKTLFYLKNDKQKHFRLDVDNLNLYQDNYFGLIFYYNTLHVEELTESLVFDTDSFLATAGKWISRTAEKERETDREREKRHKKRKGERQRYLVFNTDSFLATAGKWWISKTVSSLYVIEKVRQKERKSYRDKEKKTERDKKRLTESLFSDTDSFLAGVGRSFKNRSFENLSKTGQRMDWGPQGFTFSTFCLLS
jgi:hypothetical protein